MIEELESKNYKFKGLWENGLLYKKKRKKNEISVLIDTHYRSYSINKWEDKLLTHSSTHFYTSKEKFLLHVNNIEYDTFGGE